MEGFLMGGSCAHATVSLCRDGSQRRLLLGREAKLPHCAGWLCRHEKRQTSGLNNRNVAPRRLGAVGTLVPLSPPSVACRHHFLLPASSCGRPLCVCVMIPSSCEDILDQAHPSDLILP